MEKLMDLEQRTLISEIIKGKELTIQLRHHLQPNSSDQTGLFLIEKILSSSEKALSMLRKRNGVVGETKSPNSFPILSPRIEGSDQEKVYKKRKLMPRWTEKVKVCFGTGFEGPLDDGYSWRKYGQKDILGANFPRGYYRCSHRHLQGCLATKQVQRSDEDPTIFEITYSGRHTCGQGTKEANNSQQKLQEAEEKKSSSFGGAGLKVKTEDLDTREDYIFPSFNHITEMEMEDMFNSSDISPTFVSPATSESNYLCHMNSFALGHNVQTSESELTDIVSAPTSVTNSPIGDFDFSLDNFDIDPNFQFDNLDFFS